jgi:hypothetical protein
MMSRIKQQTAAAGACRRHTAGWLIISKCWTMHTPSKLAERFVMHLTNESQWAMMVLPDAPYHCRHRPRSLVQGGYTSQVARMHSVPAHRKLGRRGQNQRWWWWDSSSTIYWHWVTIVLDR